MIDKKKYKANQKNYYKSTHKKRKIILFDSLRKSDYHLIRLINRDNEQHKTWNTYTINRDGIIYEHFNPKYYSDYYGVKTFDKESISIVLENMGGLDYDEELNVFYNSLNEVCDNDKVFQRNWKGFSFWEKYTDEQIKSLVDLILILTEKFKIPIKTIGFNNFNEKSGAFNGILCRSNLDSNYYDVNPSFDFTLFDNMIYKD